MITKEQAKKEIEKLDNQIDQEIYKIYNLTKKETKVIENSFNESCT